MENTTEGLWTKGSPKSHNACVSKSGSEGVEAPIENILSLVKFVRAGCERRARFDSGRVVLPMDYVTYGSPEVSPYISKYTGLL